MKESCRPGESGRLVALVVAGEDQKESRGKKVNVDEEGDQVLKAIRANPEVQAKMD